MWRVGCNSFDIMCLCVCLCVTTLTGKRTDRQTWISVCRSSGRISRLSSKVKVIGQRSRSLGRKTFFRVANSVWNWIHSTPCMNGRATTWGVFKAYAFFWGIVFQNFTLPWSLFWSYAKIQVQIKLFFQNFTLRSFLRCSVMDIAGPMQMVSCKDSSSSSNHVHVFQKTPSQNW